MASMKKKKKKHSESSSKKHKHRHHHSSEKAKRKEERASAKTATTAFSVDTTHHMNGAAHTSNGHAIKLSPSPQKAAFSPNGNGFKSSSNFETTAGSNLEAAYPSSILAKQVSPPPIRISPTVPLERAVTSFDSWKFQADTKTGVQTNGGFHH